VINDRPLKVCYFGTYRDQYNRNQMMIAGLQLNGVTVIECHEALWRGIDDRVNAASGGWAKLSFIKRIIGVYWRLLNKYLQIKDYDVMIVGYPGQLDVILARLLSWTKRKPLVWDILMSIYLVAVERGLANVSRSSVNLLRFLEQVALKLPTMLIMDTQEYIDWFKQHYNVDTSRFRIVPIGADERIFNPLPYEKGDGKPFLVLYAGTFIPNHGVRYMVDAAQLLKDERGIEFELIGEGPDLEFAQQLVAENHLENVTFIHWLDKGSLVEHISRADVCLGTFGTTPQSLITVQNKIYETLAMRKPLINGDSPAIRQAFTHGEHIYLCERASGESIKNAILTLWKEPTLRECIAQNGHRLFMDRYTLRSNGRLFEQHLREVIR
jgi:glycosyltransferase involved in cell wall biosynthesis